MHVTGGSVKFENCDARNLLLTLNGQWADGNGNYSGITVMNTANLDGLVFNGVNNSGALNFSVTSGMSIERVTHISELNLFGGRTGLKTDFAAGCGTNMVVVDRINIEPGSFLNLDCRSTDASINRVNGVSFGYVFPSEELLPSGFLRPAIVTNGNPVTRGADGIIVAQWTANVDFVDIPEAGPYQGAKIYRKNFAEDLTLTHDATFPRFYLNKGGDTQYIFGESSMNLTEGTFFCNQNGSQIFSSTGGALVSSADAFYFYTAGTCRMLFDLPLAWNAPEGSTYDAPALTFTGSGKTEVVLNADNDLPEIGNITIEAGKTPMLLVFSNGTERTISGKLCGRFRLVKRGNSTLRLAGPDVRRSKSTWCEGGTLRLAHPNAAHPDNVTNSVCVIEDDIEYASSMTMVEGGTLCIGDNASLQDASFAGTGRNMVLEAGEPGCIGTGIVRGNLNTGNTTEGWKYRLKISNEGSSLLDVYTYQAPKTPTIVRKIEVCVSPINSNTIIKPDQRFVVMQYKKESNFASQARYDYESYSITTDRPKLVDLSEASVELDAVKKQLVVTGIRTKNSTVLLVF